LEWNKYCKINPQGRIKKMKNTFLLLFLLFIAGALTALEPELEYPSPRGGWQLVQRNGYHYNQGWYPNSIVHYSYNANGQIVLKTRQNYPDGVWELSSAQDYTYDSEGRLLETVYYHIGDGQWTGWLKENSLYSAAGSLEQVYAYMHGSQGWYLATQQANVYENGLLASETMYSYYSWDGTFTEYEVRSFAYDTEGRLAKKTILTVWEPGNIQGLRNLYSYLPDGRLAEILDQNRSWTGSNYEWLDDRRHIYTYDANGFLIQKLQQYNSSSQGWHDTKRYLYTNDSYGNCILEEYQMNSTEGWQDWDKWTNVYSYTATQDDEIPAAKLSLRCAPNPFFRTTEVSFQSKHPGPVQLAVYNLKGRKVRILADGEFTGGSHKLTWDGKDSRGADLPAGIYLVRMQIPGQPASVNKLTLLRQQTTPGIR